MYYVQIKVNGRILWDNPSLLISSQLQDVGASVVITYSASSGIDYGHPIQTFALPNSWKSSVVKASKPEILPTFVETVSLESMTPAGEPLADDAVSATKYSEHATEMRHHEAFLDRNPYEPTNGRCVQPLVTSYNRACRANQEWEEVIRDEEISPEHRDDEERLVDNTWDDIVDECLPSPTDRPQVDDWGLRSKAGSIRRMNSEDLYKLGGRVIGRHDALVDRPWYLVTEYVAKRLGYKAPFEDAILEQIKALVQSWMDLELDKDSVLASIVEVKEMGIEAAVALYQELASGVKVCNPSDDDALEHVNEDGFAHNRIERATHDFSPEMAMILEDGVPSAARMAHDLGISLVAAGQVRESLILQDYSDAVTIAEDATCDEEDDILDDQDGDQKDNDFGSFVSEGWHLFDDKDEPSEGSWLWLERQPAQVQVIIHQTEGAESLEVIKSIAKRTYVYAKDWTSSQRVAFWMIWHMRRDALIAQLEARVARVRKGTAKIRESDQKQLSLIGKRLHDLQLSTPTFYTTEGWSAMWATYKDCKVRVGGKLTR